MDFLKVLVHGVRFEGLLRLTGRWWDKRYDGQEEVEIHRNIGLHALQCDALFNNTTKEPCVPSTFAFFCYFLKYVLMENLVSSI